MNNFTTFTMGLVMVSMGAFANPANASEPEMSVGESLIADFTRMVFQPNTRLSRAGYEKGYVDINVSGKNIKITLVKKNVCPDGLGDGPFRKKCSEVLTESFTAVNMKFSDRCHRTFTAELDKTPVDGSKTTITVVDLSQSKCDGLIYPDAEQTEVKLKIEGMRFKRGFKEEYPYKEEHTFYAGKLERLYY